MADTNAALVLPSEATETPLSDIHDIRTLVEVPSPWTWLWWTIGLLALASILFLAFRYWQKHRQKVIDTPKVPTEPPHERARRLLEAALEPLGHPDRFCVLVSGAIRTYLEARFDLHAPERTTEEFLAELQDSHHLNIDQKHSLASFLTECDMVKFAKSEPEAYELKRLHEAALQLVSETEPGLLDATETQPSSSELSPQS